jgi:hypothetical protein
VIDQGKDGAYKGGDEIEDGVDEGGECARRDSVVISEASEVLRESSRVAKRKRVL